MNRVRCLRPAVVPFMGLSAMVFGIGAGCIIPDADIRSQGEFINTGAVRIVEPTPITARADDACDAIPGFSGCPRLPDTLPTGLIRPEAPLCVCPQPQRNLGLGGFDIIVEDPDVDLDGDPSDDILGAFFLDMPPDAEDPRDYLAYTNQLPPEEPARRFRASDVQTIERADPHLKAWTIATSGEGRWDLCNDNDGAQLKPGLHDLRLIVTDRPWYRPQLVDMSGDPIVIDGVRQFGEPVIGIPELRRFIRQSSIRIGRASYATSNYVFECFDASAVPDGIECSCED